MEIADEISTDILETITFSRNQLKAVWVES